MFCGNCGKKLIDGSMFCMECGTPVPVGKFSKAPAAAERPVAFSSPAADTADNAYKAPDEADLFGTNSFSEEAVSAFSGAMNAFGAQGFQVPTVEDVDVSAGRIRQKAPKNKGDDIRVENFSMTEGEEVEIISDDIPVIEGCSMEEDASKDVILDPYRFLGNSMDDVSLESEKPAPAVEVEPISFPSVSPEEAFAKLSAEPDVQPSVAVEPIFVQPEPAFEKPAPAVEEITPVLEEAAPVMQEVAPVVQEAAPVLEEAAPVVQEAAPVMQEAAPVVQEAASVVEEAAPVVQEAAPVVQEAAPVTEKPAPVVQEPNRIAENPVPVIQPQSQAPQQPSVYEPPAPPAPRKKGVPIWLFILVVLALIAVILIIFFFNSNN